ncbi:hypothetical protein C8R44DRAFT_641048, partial [Mycena epipterygia]
STLALATGATSTSKSGIAAPEIVPLSAIGNVAAVQGTDGDTRLYFQESDNSIQETAVSSPFNGGGHFSATIGLVPGNEALGGTPIAAVHLNGAILQEVNINITLSLLITRRSSR